VPLLVVEIRVGEVNVGHVHAFRRRRQEDRVAPGDAQREVREEPGVLVVEAQTQLTFVGEVPLDVGVQERLAFLDGEDLPG
jgi:hypothetical protein